jgi:hypothetical protein
MGFKRASSKAGCGPKTYQAPNVAKPSIITIGTKYEDIKFASC